MKLKDKVKVLNFKSKYDSKKKINRSNKKVPDNIINKIDNGITSETLLSLKKDYPIYMYGTQITIHGIFNNIDSYCYGYKHLFINKNKSLGVKYGAIDESKRQELKVPLRYLGFEYKKNSNENNFTIRNYQWFKFS